MHQSRIAFKTVLFRKKSSAGECPSAAWRVWSTRNWRRSLVCSQPATSQDRLSHSISYSISRMEPNFKEFICCLKWQQGNCWKYGNCHNKWISEVFMKYGITIEGCTKLPNNLITYNTHGRPNIILHVCKCRQEAIPEHTSFTLSWNHCYEYQVTL